MEFHQPSFRKGPKGLDSIDMFLSLGEFVGSMMDTIMLFEPEVNQTVITAPSIGINYAIWINASPNNGLQGFSGTVRDNLCVYMTSTLQDTENWRFSVGSAPVLSFDTPGSEIGFIDLDLSTKRGESHAIFANSNSEQLQVAIDCISVQPGQLSDFLGVKIERKKPYNGCSSEMGTYLFCN